MPDYKSDLPTNYYFGGGSEATAGTLLAVIFLLAAIILILVLPRKYAYVPFLIAAVLLPIHVVLLVGSLHFDATRMLIIGGWLRVLVRRERFPGRLHIIDKTVLAFAFCSAVMYCLLWQHAGAVVNRLGLLVTTMGSYFLMRILVRDQEDVVRVIKTFGVVVVVLAPFLWYEHLSAYNIFRLLGAPGITNVRDGQIRAQGPFGHPIPAGVVGAVLLPLFVELFFHRRSTRLLAVAAVISCTAMVFASRSSTAVMTYAAVILGLALWPLRKRMRSLRWGLVMLLLGLQLLMARPVWFVINRASDMLGGSGWHRSMLVDNFVRHFFDWWLIGTRQNAGWGWDMWDVDNAYVNAGLSGGLLSFILFIAVIVCAFKVVGKGRKLAEPQPRELRLIWVLGVSLFANVIAFFGIVYFDQSIVPWYTLLAMIAVVPTFVKVQDRRQLQVKTTPERIESGPMAFPSPELYGHGHSQGL